MQSCNAEHHQGTKHKEISNKRNMPKPYTTTGYITLGLCKLNASRTTSIKYKNHVKNSNHSCKTNPWKKYQSKHHGVPKNLTLVTNTTKYRLQICTLVHICHKWRAPLYLQNLIQEKQNKPFPGLISETKKDILLIPHTRKHTFATRSFTVCGPNLWNSLSDSIREEINYKKIKTKLKKTSVHNCIHVKHFP